MPRFAANLSYLFTERPFLERFAAAQAAGFAAVEFHFPYEHDRAALAEVVLTSGLDVVLFNLPPGDWAAGERGIACLPGREAEFAASVDQALQYAAILGNRRLHIMAGVPSADVSAALCAQTYRENLRLACTKLAAAGRTALIEPINTRDMPGYFLSRQRQAEETITAVAAPNLRLQLDFYHLQITEGDLSVNYQRSRARVEHIQIAGVPERHEPDDGEVNYPYLFALLDASGYSGWVGCEYRPRGNTSAGLGWLRAWQERARGAAKPATA